ncbi:MAG: methyl-accepting chemotaxis protein, partial [Bradyrhizobium guangdongense]
MNSCSLSKAQAATALAGVFAAAALVFSLIGSAGIFGAVSSAASLLVLGYAVWCLRRTAIAVDEVTDVCRKAARGDLEARILS